jgi:nitric oxide dioxygenase
MGLPAEMSASTIATIKATAPVVAPHALEITRTFYKGLFEAHPELFSIFNKRNQLDGTQPQALADAVVAYASNIDQLQNLVGFQGSPVDIIAAKHAGLQVLPEQYPIVHQHLMEAVGKVLGDAVTPEIGAAWSESVLFLAKVLIDAEEALYASAAERPGGWSGFTPFKVSAVEQLTDDVKTFRLERDGGAAAVGIDFTPGQFITLRVDPKGDGLTAPRHYTLTSSPGEATLECTIKKVGEGDGVSRFMHDHIAVGSTVEVSPPFGVFNVRPADGRKAVLLSAGIGMTPMLTLGKQLGDRVALVAHVDGSPASHPHADRLASLGAPTLFKYASDEGGKQVPAAQLAAEVLAAVGGDGAATDCDFYVCGSPGFESGVTKALRAAGVTTIYSEAFKGHTDAD